ncbi:MAG: cation:proton antiporter, partial [Phycisphaerales bacterium]|nr:cation:proton antiporter [Phycisphaerales bacterium]
MKTQAPLSFRTRKNRFLPSSKFTLAALLVCCANALGSGDAKAPGEIDMIHRMMMLSIQFGAIIFAAKFFNMLFERFKMPGVLGELCAGMVIGPFALGQVALPGFAGGLFAPFSAVQAVSPELTGIATIASIVLLFDVGLETDLKLLIRYSFAGSLVGIGGVVASFALGMAAMWLFSESMLNEQVGFFHYKCLFMGVVSTATSVGITARILSEKRKLDSPEGVTILSAAVIDDVIGIIMLAIVAGIAQSQQAAEATGGSTAVNWGHIGTIGAKAVGVWLVATVIGIAASRKISVLLKYFGERTSIAVMAFGMALILAGLFEEAGLAMIIGGQVVAYVFNAPPVDLPLVGTL